MTGRDRIDLDNGQPDRRSWRKDATRTAGARDDEERVSARFRAAASSFTPGDDPLVAIRRRLHARARRRRVLAALPALLLVVGGAGYGLAANDGLAPGLRDLAGSRVSAAAGKTAPTATAHRATSDGSGALPRTGSPSDSSGTTGGGTVPANGEGAGAGNFSLRRALGLRIPTPRPSLLVSSSTTGPEVRVVITVLFCFGDARSASGPLPQATVGGRAVSLHPGGSAEWTGRLSLSSTEAGVPLRTEVTCANGQADTTTILP